MRLTSDQARAIAELTAEAGATSALVYPSDTGGDSVVIHLADDVYVVEPDGASIHVGSTTDVDPSVLLEREES